ncbi:MAG: amidohydrolase family protein, partial [Deferribacteraceae bacterium]|nr:amidohydrolase family protein [Deferribacteraceae bacterium]
MKTLLKNGNVVTDSVKQSNILIEDGVIKAITTETSAADEVVDCTGKYIVPGLIDMHVHLREPGQASKETIETGVEAAIKGGVTTLCCMANTSPVIDSSILVQWVIGKSKAANMAEVLPYACVTKGMQGEELTEMGDLLR